MFAYLGHLMSRGDHSQPCCYFFFLSLFFFFFFFNFVASFFYLACLPPPKVGQILVIQLFVADSKKGERSYMKIKKIPSPKHTSYVKLWVGVLCYPVTTRTALEILYLSRFFLQLSNPVTHVFLFAAGCHIIRRGDILKY